MRCDPHERVESDAERASPCPTGEGRSPTGGDACAGLAWDSERSPCGSPPGEAQGATPARMQSRWHGQDLYAEDGRTP